MATRRKAEKTSKKVELNAVENSSKKKTFKSAGFVVVLVFVLGLILGAGAWWLVCRNDCFEINGSDQITLTLEETYEDDGVKIVAFGKNEQSSVVIETDLKQDDLGRFYAEEVGTYYIKYKSSCFKYGTLFKIEKIRLVTFVEVSEGEI